MKFVSIDVETANADMSSICSIGVVIFDANKPVSEWYSLINPKDCFDDLNVGIHGITERMVENSPTYKEIVGIINPLLRNEIVVAHTHFDRSSIHQTALRWSVESPICTWLDSAKVVRRTWEECAYSGYGLNNVCKMIGYEFQHHNALEDAKAAGYVLLAAMEKSGLSLDAILKRACQPLNLETRHSIKRDGNPDGVLFGEVVVFTGALEIPRREAADLASSLGCTVAQGVTKKTTLLVVGDVDIARLSGHEKTAKHRAAEEMIAKGFPIRIIRETDFRSLVSILPSTPMSG